MVTRAVEESVLIKMGTRAVYVHVVMMTVVARVLSRVGEMMIRDGLERMEDDNASVMGPVLKR